MPGFILYFYQQIICHLGNMKESLFNYFFNNIHTLIKMRFQKYKFLFLYFTISALKLFNLL